MRRPWPIALTLLFWSCVDLTLPEPPPPPGPGTLQATLVYAVPGSSEKLPAANARVRLLSSSLETRANADGFFWLDGLSDGAGGGAGGARRRR
jgi:hypothetical protein